MEKIKMLDFEEFFVLVEQVASSLHLIAQSEAISDPMTSNAFMLASTDLYDSLGKYKPMFYEYIEQKRAQTADN